MKPRSRLGFKTGHDDDHIDDDHIDDDHDADLDDDHDDGDDGELNGYACIQKASVLSVRTPPIFFIFHQNLG